jgi:cell division protein FtsL
MRDWAGGIESRNYGIKRQTDRRNLIDLLSIIFSVLVIGGSLLSYAWSRSQIVEMGYEEQNLQAHEKTILRIQNNLILEEETLKNPERIDGIARNDLGMVLVRTNQLVAPRARDSQAGDSTTLAMVNPARSAAEPRKPSATN